MSYGYLLASTRPMPELQKNRRFRFWLLDSSGGLHVYSRLEESSELTIRDGDSSAMTSAGMLLLASIAAPFFFMDYLLTRRQSEYDLVQVAIEVVRVGGFKPLRISTGEKLSLNCLYRVSP